jgi:hypothetical protein
MLETDNETLARSQEDECVFDSFRKEHPGSTRRNHSLSQRRLKESQIAMHRFLATGAEYFADYHHATANIRSQAEAHNSICAHREEDCNNKRRDIISTLETFRDLVRDRVTWNYAIRLDYPYTTVHVVSDPKFSACELASVANPCARWTLRERASPRQTVHDR